MVKARENMFFLAFSDAENVFFTGFGFFVAKIVGDENSKKNLEKICNFKKNMM